MIRRLTATPVLLYHRQPMSRRVDAWIKKNKGDKSTFYFVFKIFLDSRSIKPHKLGVGKKGSVTFLYVQKWFDGIIINDAYVLFPPFSFPRTLFESSDVSV